MTQILNRRGESHIENIISHRISENKSNYYEYHVKMNNTDSAIWLSEMEIIKLNANLLESYKKKAAIEIFGNDEENCNMIDFSKFIALNFNECMGIKLEIGVVYDESTMDTSESIDQVPNSNVKVKEENVEFAESSDNYNKMICDKSLKDSLTTTSALNSHSLQKEPAFLPEQKERNGDISKVSSNSMDLIDRFFDQLPIVSKVTNDSRNINKYSLVPLKLEILKGIIEIGDLDLLQSYMYSDQRESLENLIGNYPCLFILAAKNNDLPIVSSLLSLGVNINSKDTESKTALMFACENESESLIDLLVTNGASLNNINSNKDSILFFCCQINKPKAIQTLLKLGADFSRIQPDSQLPLNLYAKSMKLADIQRIAENHISQFSVNIKKVISLQLGPKIRLDFRVMPIYVISPLEIQDEIHINFDTNSKLLKKNSTNLLFILTGIIIGSEMKCFFSDCFQIKSVALNDVEQLSLTQNFKTITSFNSLKKQNKLSIKFENAKCRKTRIILAAYNLIT